jgi:hypothetical protein
VALADDPDSVSAAGMPAERLPSEALRRLATSQPPGRKRFDLDATLADGGPVSVWLGDHELPIGDLGHPRVDAKLLLAMLAKDGSRRRAPTRARPRRGRRPRRPRVSPAVRQAA